MISFDLGPYVMDMVYEYISGVRREGDKLHYSCPLCDDRQVRKRRGWYYIKTNSFFCWNAGCPANSGINTWKYLSLLTGKTEAEVKAEVVRRAGAIVNNALSSSAPSSAAADLFDEHARRHDVTIKENLLDDNWTEDLPEVARNVLVSRKIYSAPYLGATKFYYNKQSKRLVIPWSDDYWQERALFKYQEKEKGKYLFPPNKDISKPLFGLKSADLSGRNIYILEGLFDSIFVKGGLAAGSITMSEYQKELLRRISKGHDVVFLMDNQWKDRTALEKSIKIAGSDPYQKLFIWPEAMKPFKDVNESVIASDRFIDVWKDDEFLSRHVFSGILASMELAKIRI